MRQKFSTEAKHVMLLAQEEAHKLRESYVSTEHILLALCRDSDHVAARSIKLLGLQRETIRQEISAKLVSNEGEFTGEFQLTPRAKMIMGHAEKESELLGSNYIGTEHIFLGLLHEKNGVGPMMLDKMGVTLESARKAVKSVLRETGGRTTESLRGTMHYAANTLSGEDLLQIAKLTREEIESIFDTTYKLKENKIPRSEQAKVLQGKTLAMIFEKPSLRTRVSFETGIFQLGGHGIYLQPSDISLGKRESIADAARNFDRMVDIIMARVFEHETVTELAKHANIPVINGLSDLEHPCQALADFYTVLEKKDHFEGLKFAFIGDGNNVSHSLMLLSAKLGTNFMLGCPEGYGPDEKVLATAKGFAKETGCTVEVVHDAKEAAKDADIVYTDVWTSMGQEEEEKKRKTDFAAFQVNSDIMKQAKEEAIFMHCLPAHRGEEVTDDVIDSKSSVVFDEAENRLHVQKAIMMLIAG